jgi:hypothetical protein
MILSATKLTDHVHFGMALIVDKSTGHYTRNHTDTPNAVLISVQVIVGSQGVLTSEELLQHIGHVANQELIIWEDNIIVL